MMLAADEDEQLDARICNELQVPGGSRRRQICRFSVIDLRADGFCPWRPKSEPPLLASSPGITELCGPGYNT